MLQISGRVCKDDHRISLILLDMGVAQQPNMERKKDRGVRWGEAGGSTPKNTHLLSFPFSLCLSLSLPPPVLSLCLFISVHHSPLSGLRSSCLSHTHTHTHTHTGGGLSLIQHLISTILLFKLIQTPTQTHTEPERSLACPPTHRHSAHRPSNTC